jgi:NADP-dependent 3-hydroxy acid dehydrogenase YdfG
MPTIMVCGYGPGISQSVAKKFGAEGFSVALVARSKDKLGEGVAELHKMGIQAGAFPTDLGDAEAVKVLVGRVRAELGPITVLHWNAYASTAGDLLSASAADIRAAMDVSVTSFAVAVQETLPDLKKQKESAVLVTGGGFAHYDANVDAMAVQWSSMGTALGKAAQHKLVGLLAARLKGDGVYVGEVMVLGMVKGTRFDSGSATLEAATVADTFWDLYRSRSELSVSVS